MDRFSLRVVVLGLVALLVIGAIGIVYLANGNHAVPDVLKELTVGALAALAGIATHAKLAATTETGDVNVESQAGGVDLGTALLVAAGALAVASFIVSAAWLMPVAILCIVGGLFVPDSD